MNSSAGKPFVNLHTHSWYTVLGATASPKDILVKAQALGCPAVALNDVGHGYGLVDFYQQAKKLGGEVKPIMGVELYLATDAHYEQRAGVDGREPTIVLLAMNDVGYRNILHLTSVAALEGEYLEKQRVDMDDLRAHQEGLVLLTGGEQGVVAKLLHEQGEEVAEARVKTLLDIFGPERMLGELVARDRPITEAANRWLVKVAPSLGLSLVVTSEARYIDAEDEEACEALYCVSSGEMMSNPGRNRVVADSAFKSWEEMERVLTYIPSGVREAAREKSLEVAAAVDMQLEFGQNLLPNFGVPEGFTEATYLHHLCKEAIPMRYPQATAAEKKEIDERLEYELSIISKMGFDAYFLIVEDFIRYAKEQGISVGPGRGSAAGSIVSYLLDITTIDPLKYGLLFERFLNPARISMPDIDIDFSDERREEVMEYVFEKYGRDKVSKVCTFGTLSAKAALKDVGRAYGMDFTLTNSWTKTLPGKPGFMLEEAKEIAEFTQMMSRNQGLQKVFEVAQKIEGCVRHVSVHACAVIIAKDALTQSCPLQWSPTDSSTKITQYPYQQLEALGLLKMDFLGLKNLSVLEKTLEHVKATTGEEIDLATIPLDDKNVFEMLGRGETTGVFQFESAGMRRYLKELQPTEFEDLVAMNALYRPGPMEYIPQYIEGKKNPEKVEYMHPVLEPLLKQTYSIAVYQEQVLKIAQVFAGFSLGEADILRKAIGKKIASVLAEQRDKFISGAIAKGYEGALAEKMFDEIIVPFSGYGFNRSHAVCYARIAYETAWCRANHPVSFMAAMMTTDRNNTERIALEVNECAAMGVTVLPPSVNDSGSHFNVVQDEDGAWVIRFGLTAIKGLGEETANVMMEERERGGKFKDVSDFATRVPSRMLNKKTLEALAFAGALDAFGERADIVASLEGLSKYAKEVQEQAKVGQMGLFAMEAPEAVSFELSKGEASENELLGWEKKSLGLYVSGHPMREFEDYIRAEGTCIGEINAEMDKEKITVHGMLTKVRRLTTKTGKPMAITEIEDMTGVIEIPVFPATFASLDGGVLEPEAFVRVEGKVSVREGGINLIADTMRRCKPQEKATEIQTSDPEQDQQEEPRAPETRTVTVPEALGKEGVGTLKSFLRSRQSAKGQEVVLKIGSQSVKVPFLVDTSGDFDQMVGEICG